MQRLRLVSEAYKEIKQSDPNTDLTLYGLQTLVKSGVIPSVIIGNRKRLIDMQIVERYLKGDVPSRTETTNYGIIRQVN